MEFNLFIIPMTLIIVELAKGLWKSTKSIYRCLVW